jgi:predicted N-acetyltransferase YhbS
MVDVTIQYDDEVSVAEMQALMEAMEGDESGRFPPSAVFHYSLRNAAREEVALRNGINVTARDPSGGLVGYMRIVSDRAYIHYVVDVMVHPDRQGERIGSTMVRAALDALINEGFIKVLLTAIPGKEDFYRRLGFRETMSPVLALRGEDFAEEH